jgi:beta-glucosidase/6-phospho-beta-glucosidase/beta-galactosidase
MLTDLGMTENRIAVFWDPANPTTIVDQAFLDRSIPEAMRRGIDVMFAIYPLKARGLVDTPNGVQLFAQYAAKVAQRYPYVRKMICLNEGNQPRFHQPQYDEAGNGISGFVQEQAMAACYDALKAVDPGITVIAFGLSPRGNDDFDAPSNVSHSPIRFLK